VVIGGGRGGSALRPLKVRASLWMKAWFGAPPDRDARIWGASDDGRSFCGKKRAQEGFWAAWDDRTPTTPTDRFCYDGRSSRPRKGGAPTGSVQSLPNFGTIAMQTEANQKKACGFCLAMAEDHRKNYCCGEAVSTIRRLTRKKHGTSRSFPIIRTGVWAFLCAGTGRT